MGAVGVLTASEIVVEGCLFAVAIGFCQYVAGRVIGSTTDLAVVVPVHANPVGDEHGCADAFYQLVA